MSFYKRKKRLQFLPEPLVESRAVLKNPSRGWYQIHSFRLEQEVDFEELYWCLHKEDRLALIFIQIGAFRAMPIPAEATERLTKILSFFRENGKEMILRIAYDNQGNGITAEPDFLKEIEGHMNRIGPILRPFADDILVAQGLFVGSWGEMHDSKFLAQDKLKRLAATWRQALGNEIPIAVRTPSQWRLLHLPKETARQTKIGLFDDGMFGSVSHLGTYGVKSKGEAAWEEPWCPADEKDFVGSVAEAVAYGGEALAPEEGGAGGPYGTVKDVVKEMRALGVSYLNRVHDAGRIKAWKEQICQAADLEPMDERHGVVWQGAAAFDYIGAHLGYRYVVRDVSFVEKKLPHFLLVIENTGFAACTEDVELYLVFTEEITKYGTRKRVNGIDISEKITERKPEENATEREKQRTGKRFPVPYNLRNLRQGSRVSLEMPLPGIPWGNYQVFLEMRRKKDGQVIYFSNEPVERQVLLGIFSGS